ncbi:MAG TPA: M23 family metallopeptidase, partial [Anaerovoracaceae bacterium]|nr:M23 family metallopeptidase [Anaerovoracaceae bacterium]
INAAVSAVKNRRIIYTMIASFFMFLIVMCALIVSIPTIMMQSLLPQDNKEIIKTMSVFAQEEINKTENEKNSFLQNLLDSLSGENEEGEKVVASINGDINYEDVLIIYALKSNEFWEAKEHDAQEIRDIANAFVEINGFTVSVKSFEEVITQVGLNTTQQAIALNMYAYNIGNAIDEVNKTGTIFIETIRELQSEGEYAGGHLILPTPGFTRVSSAFGYRIHPTLHVRKLHTGIDIPVPTGTEVVAANSGKVILAGKNSSYGNVVVIDHGGGITTLYAHNSRLLVKVGQNVQQGEVISSSGNTGRSTGPHLHFEVRIDGEYKDPMNWL